MTNCPLHPALLLLPGAHVGASVSGAGASFGSVFTVTDGPSDDQFPAASLASTFSA
ncbi:hypothetical protein [Paenibacillus xanthanilyticus]|uniref:Uncharacterized protein n=1 Tax=Paenibacillus xanthanilyticus TaxID=1783531 RepID=A0ABV8K0Y9_9BACL